VKIFKYQIDPQLETQVWVCGACKKENWEKILLKQWKLIDSDEAKRHKCGLCVQRQEAAELPEGAPASKAA